MARRNFGARNSQAKLLLLGLTRLTEREAALMGSAWLATSAERRAELRAEARRQLRAAPAIARRSWSNARAYAADAVRNAAYRRVGAHYSKLGDENTLPWGAARAAARDVAAAWVVLPWLDKGLANELMAPGQGIFRYLRSK